MPIVSFDNATVAGSAPTREQLAAALPESERGSAAPYLRHFQREARYSNDDLYAPYWAQAYLSNRDELLDIAPSAMHIGDVASRLLLKRLLDGETYPSPANILTGMSDEDEFRIISLFDGQCTFGPGLLFLTEDRRIDRMQEVFIAFNLSSHVTRQAMDILVAPSNWKRAENFDTLLFQSIFCPADFSLSHRYLRATRRMAEGAGIIEAAELRARFTVTELERLADDGVALEYALTWPITSRPR